MMEYMAMSVKHAHGLKARQNMVMWCMFWACKTQTRRKVWKIDVIIQARTETGTDSRGTPGGDCHRPDTPGRKRDWRRKHGQSVNHAWLCRTGPAPGNDYASPISTAWNNGDKHGTWRNNSYYGPAIVPKVSHNLNETLMSHMRHNNETLETLSA